MNNKRRNSFEETLTASIEELMKDREALALRNRTMTEAMHQIPLRHQLRRGILQMLSLVHLPSRRATQSNRILIIRPDHLGDLLLTTPAIHSLRKAYPNAEIHALVGPWSAGVLQNNPDLDLVLTIPFPGFTRGTGGNWHTPYQYAIQTAARLRRIGYAQALIMRHDHWWGAWLAQLAGIPKRLGYNHPDTKLFLTQAIEHQHEHAVRQSVRLVEALTHNTYPDEQLVYQFEFASTDKAYVQGYLEEWQLDENRPIFCIHPGSGAKVKLWKVNKWAQVADILSEQLQATVVFTGGDHELNLIQSIIAQMQHSAVVMAGGTQVSQLAALYARAKVVLGPDSGPLHLAAAVGTPTVTLFGPADPIEFRTWGSSNTHHILTTNIDCRPCRILDWSSDNLNYHPCVRDITVNDVLSAARTVVDSNATNNNSNT